MENRVRGLSQTGPIAMSVVRPIATANSNGETTALEGLSGGHYGVVLGVGNLVSSSLSDCACCCQSF